MANHWYSTTVCDGCGKVVARKDGQPDDNTNWIHVQQFTTGTNEWKDLDYVEWDFCSFGCLRNWVDGLTAKSPAECAHAEQEVGDA